MIVQLWECSIGHNEAVTDAEIELLRTAYDEAVRCPCGALLVRVVADAGSNRAAVQVAHVRLQKLRARYAADHPDDEKEEL